MLFLRSQLLRSFSSSWLWLLRVDVVGAPSRHHVPVSTTRRGWATMPPRRATRLNEALRLLTFPTPLTDQSLIWEPSSDPPPPQVAWPGCGHV